jgi:hypothetical protein
MSGTHLGVRSSEAGQHNGGVVEFVAVRFEASGRSWPDLVSFYGGRLGLGVEDIGEEPLEFRVGDQRLIFRRSEPDAEPFYHFALLVPGDRFEAASEWFAARVELLPDPDSGDTAFHFDAWDARASYFVDPVGNIVEFIAHRTVAETGSREPFDPAELAGFSEVGVVVDDKPAATRTLQGDLGLEIWDGEVDDARRLAFAGERARTLIVCPAGRGWMPTGRPAEIHPVDVALRAPRKALSQLPGAPHRIVGL